MGTILDGSIAVMKNDTKLSDFHNGVLFVVYVLTRYGSRTYYLFENVRFFGSRYSDS